MKNTAILKGLGILLIITHNYMHWLPQCVDENEYTFCGARVMQLCQYISQGGPHVLLNIISHYGHYGVAIFLFLSGYGLVKKYEQGNSGDGDSWWRFLWRHALKLWKLMVPAVALFVILQMATGTWNRPYSRLLPVLGFYSNLQPHRDLLLGPWWWFGLMMQFYILWRLILYRRGKWVLYTLMSLCLIVQIGCAWIERGVLDRTDTLTCYLHYNFPPSMLAFGLGVAHARYCLEWLRRWWSPLVGAFMVILGSFNAGIWCIAPVGAIMVALAFINPEGSPSSANATLSASAPTYLNLSAILGFFGYISAWLFALHPIVRDYCIPLARRGSDLWLYLSILIYLCVSASLAWLFTSFKNKKTVYPHNKADKK